VSKKWCAVNEERRTLVKMVKGLADSDPWMDSQPYGCIEFSAEEVRRFISRHITEDAIARLKKGKHWAAAIDAAEQEVTQHEAELVALGVEAATAEEEGVQAVWDFSPIAPMQQARSGAAAVACGGSLYVMGGVEYDRNTPFFPRHSALASVERYSPDTGCWEKLASMSTPRWGAAAAELNGKIYVIGGLNCPLRWEKMQAIVPKEYSREKLASVEVYDPATGAWTSVAPMKTARSDATAAVYNGSLYIFGGNNRKLGSLRSVERFNPDKQGWFYKGEWEEMEAMPTAKRGASAAVIDGVLFIIGGDVSSSMEQFDGSKWSGMSEVEGCAEVEQFDGSKWTTFASMDTGRAAPATAVLGRNLYVIGGISRNIATGNISVTNIVESMTFGDSPIVSSVMHNGVCVEHTTTTTQFI